jgi:hypothetical protein
MLFAGCSKSDAQPVKAKALIRASAVFQCEDFIGQALNMLGLSPDDPEWERPQRRERGKHERLERSHHGYHFESLAKIKPPPAVMPAMMAVRSGRVPVCR